jgi:Zn-finger nucleic acid-binding protein
MTEQIDLQKYVLLHVCPKCKHAWYYRGTGKYILCPKCKGVEKNQGWGK